MEVLLEYRGSRRQITVASGETLTDCVTTELRRVGRGRASVHTANADLGSTAERDVYLLQKWSPQWDCYIDVHHVNQVQDGDKLTVVAKPRPPSKLLQLLCCCCQSPDAGVVQSRKNGVSKNEEIQALDYRFAEESETHSNWDSQSISPTEEKGPNDQNYVRDNSGRASWIMVPQLQQPEDPPLQEDLVDPPLHEDPVEPSLAGSPEETEESLDEPLTSPQDAELEQQGEITTEIDPQEPTNDETQESMQGDHEPPEEESEQQEDIAPADNAANEAVASDTLEDDQEANQSEAETKTESIDEPVETDTAVDNLATDTEEVTAQPSTSVTDTSEN